MGRFLIYNKNMNNSEKNIFIDNNQMTNWDTLKDETSFTGEKALPTNNYVDIVECLPEASERILAATRIPNRGSMVRSTDVTIEDYKNNHLEPRTVVCFEGAEVAISNIFDAYGRNATIGYVKSGDEYVARSFYQSNSQGEWRLLPDYAVDDFSHSIWYGKGYSEEMTNLPSILQKALSEQAKKTKVKTIDDPDRLLLSTAKKYDIDLYQFMKRNKKLKSDAYQEIDQTPEVSFGELTRAKERPEDVRVPESQMPNFTQEIDNWESEASLYGVLTNRVYDSQDGKLRYTFSEDKAGRAFVSNIEYISKVTSSGVREKWVSGGDVETPLFEYDSQASGYGNELQRVGKYVGMWDNYLSKMDIIKAYLKARE